MKPEPDRDLQERMPMDDDAFDEFLLRFEPQLSSSGERYLKLRAKLVKFFQWHRCVEPDGLADEAIARLLNKICAGAQIEKPWAYANAVAQNIFKEYLRSQGRLTQLQDDWDSAVEEPGEFVECARHCIEQLPDDKRSLLEQYYSDEDGRAAMARRMGTSLAGLRTRIHRVRAEIRSCYLRCISGSD